MKARQGRHLAMTRKGRRSWGCSQSVARTRADPDRTRDAPMGPGPKAVSPSALTWSARSVIRGLELLLAARPAPKDAALPSAVPATSRAHRRALRCHPRHHDNGWQQPRQQRSPRQAIQIKGVRDARHVARRRRDVPSLAWCRAAVPGLVVAEAGRASPLSAFRTSTPDRPQP